MTETQPVETATKEITLDREDLKVIAKYMPAISAGRKAEEAVSDYVGAIIRRAGGDPKRDKYQLAGNKIVLVSEPPQ